jgi:phosphosulfolactate phosphohydrolase-like enzyme
MAVWNAFHNANWIHAGAQISFFELSYDPAMTVERIRAGDDLVIVAPNGTRSRGSVLSVGDGEIVIREQDGGAWVLTATTENEKTRAVIYPDMLNAIWTVRHCRLE